MQSKAVLSKQIAYISINPSGKFVKSAQVGFKDVGLFPEFMIHVNPGKRIKNEFKKYRLGIFSNFLIPKFKQHFGNKRSFKNEIIEIEIPITKKVGALNSEETIRFIKDNNIKYLINCGAGIFRKKITDINGLYIVNAHAGKLPDYRNMNVVEWALYNSQKVIGTIHLINSGIDTGDILLEEEIYLNKVSDYIVAREYAFDQVIKIAGKAVLDFAEGKIKPKKQPKEGKRWYTMHPYFHKKLNLILKTRND